MLSRGWKRSQNTFPRSWADFEQGWQPPQTSGFPRTWRCHCVWWPRRRQWSLVHPLHLSAGPGHCRLSLVIFLPNVFLVPLRTGKTQLFHRLEVITPRKKKYQQRSAKYNPRSVNGDWQLPPKMLFPQQTTLPSTKIAAKELQLLKSFQAGWLVATSPTPPHSGSPQVTMEPSANLAPKADQVAWMASTPCSRCLTDRQSPPDPAWPQDTTWPSASIAANARSLDWISLTFLKRSRTPLQSPP